MPTSSPDWSTLASENERLVDSPARPVPPRPAFPATEPTGPSGLAGPSELSGPSELAGLSGPSELSGLSGSPGPAPATAALASRRRWRRHAAAAAAAGTAAAAAITGATMTSVSASVSPLAWRFSDQVKQGASGDFTAIAAVGTGRDWAFSGDGVATPSPFGGGKLAAPTAFTRTGATWAPAPFPGRPGERVVAAQATSATNVWAFANAGLDTSRALRWNGRSWSTAGSFSTAIGGAVVVSATSVWVFGNSPSASSGTDAWHFNGRAWSRVPGSAGLVGGSARSAAAIWAFGGTSVARWTGTRWVRTSVAHLLPAPIKGGLNHPGVTAILAQTANSVWAVGNGNGQDGGGPLVVLHFDGHAWSRVAASGAFTGFGVVGQVAPDGRGGLWIPLPGAGGGADHLVHYSHSHLTAAALPGGRGQVEVDSVTWIPGTFQALAGGFTHNPANPGVPVTAVVLRFER
jgi:hypothetical protein